MDMSAARVADCLAAEQRLGPWRLWHCRHRLQYRSHDLRHLTAVAQVRLDSAENTAVQVDRNQSTQGGAPPRDPQLTAGNSYFKMQSHVSYIRGPPHLQHFGGKLWKFWALWPHLSWVIPPNLSISYGGRLGKRWWHSLSLELSQKYEFFHIFRTCTDCVDSSCMLQW